MTSYYITTVKENISWAAEILADILFNATYPQNEVEKERGVVIEEIKMYRDNPMMGLSGDFVKFLYGKSKIGCWNISGDEEDILKIDRKKVVDYQAKYLDPKEIVVVLSGDVKLEAKEIIKDYFEGFINTKAQRLPEINISVSSDKKLEIKKDIEQAHFCLGVESIAWTDPRKYALKLLDIIIAGNSSSRLYTKIREENALAYYVLSVSDNYKETGYLGVQSGVRLEKLNEALEISRNELLNIKNSISENELNRAKEYLSGKTKLLMDRTDFISDYLGERVLLENRLDTIENELKRYIRVSINDLKNLADELFKTDRIKSVVVKK
jgi:predicted Zn-dependent peptidase